MTKTAAKTSSKNTKVSKTEDIARRATDKVALEHQERVKTLVIPTIEIKEAAMKELVAFYNEYAPIFGKRVISKFADRLTAEIRVKTLMLDLEALAEPAEEGDDELWGRRSYDSKPSELSTLLNVEGKNDEVIERLNGKVEEASAEKHVDLSKLTSEGCCPKCGSSEIYTGRVDPKDRKKAMASIIDEEYITGCHLCDWEVDVRKLDGKYVRDNGQAGQVREAMKESLKLDRTIQAFEGKKSLGTWKNAFRMWKDHQDWMTSAQQDRLTAKLYEAAKRGEKASVEINGRRFELVNV